MNHHHYRTKTEWTGNRGSGTIDHRAYSRDHLISAPGKASTIAASSDPAFRGDAARYNPEELFLSSISACHMLWYLHLASVNGITVLEYIDHPEGIMAEGGHETGRFTEVTLNPAIVIAQADQVEKAKQLHMEAGKKCFIANSIDVPVRYGGTVTAG